MINSAVQVFKFTKIYVLAYIAALSSIFCIIGKRYPSRHEYTSP